MTPLKNSPAQARARRKRGVGGIPPRPSVPPERLPAEAPARASHAGGSAQAGGGGG